MVKPGDIALYSGNDSYAKAIQFITRSKWSHCGLVVAVDQNGPVILEATQQGLKMTHLTLTTPGWEFRDAAQTDAERVETTQWALRKFAKGCPYNFADIFFIALHLLCKRWSLVVEGTGRYFCSEMLGLALTHGGADIDAPELLSPGDLDILYPKVVQ